MHICTVDWFNDYIIKVLMGIQWKYSWYPIGLKMKHAIQILKQTVMMILLAMNDKIQIPSWKIIQPNIIDNIQIIFTHVSKTLYIDKTKTLSADMKKLDIDMTMW